MIKVTCELPNYDEPAKTSTRVEAHWNNPKLVVLIVGEERRTVAAEDLRAALDNATNSNRH